MPVTSTDRSEAKGGSPLEPVYANQFRKDFIRVEKRRKNMDKLIAVMEMLLKEIPLLPRHENHPLHGNYEGKWECHVEPNWLLIYRIDKADGSVVFYRTGSHSDLF